MLNMVWLLSLHMLDSSNLLNLAQKSQPPSHGNGNVGDAGGRACWTHQTQHSKMTCCGERDRTNRSGPTEYTAIKLSTKMTKQVPRGMSLYQAWIVDDASGRRYRRGREDGARCGDGGRAGELRSKVEETIKQLGDEEEK
ncbi:hypothetical protein BC936DRAFT_138189 [Jimgerdemannia flammicorona]|uniref:Uncharacterized protein n=1 Tax=Jimgerdemannia flammicorona TaxID=994334 RepID=A0A433CVX9_9FUNG|nr:hypothetical protein BC936DRAFT_138189 [Jimgerdemannia flammicorona]